LSNKKLAVNHGITEGILSETLFEKTQKITKAIMWCVVNKIGGNGLLLHLCEHIYSLLVTATFKLAGQK
jgi:hypothetical protein